MIQESAKVLSVSEAGEIIIETTGIKTCHRCVNSGGCGISVLAKYFGAKQHQFPATSEITVNEGDLVLIRIEKSSLLLAAGLMYLLPLMTMLFSIALLQFGLGITNESAHIIAALVGLGIGIVSTRRISTSGFGAGKFEPIISSRYLPGVEAGATRQNQPIR